MIPRVIHRRMRLSKKKRMKQEAMLRDMTLPTTQYKFSRAEIDDDIIVIDGGTVGAHWHFLGIVVICCTI